MNNCYQPIIGLWESWEFLFWNCLSEVVNSWDQFWLKSAYYRIDSWVNYNKNDILFITWKTFVEMQAFFDVIKQNDSNLLNQYIKTLVSKDQYVVYENIYKLINSQKYKNWLLTIRMEYEQWENRGVGFKYYLFDGRQYDFSLRWYIVDDMWPIYFSRYKDVMYKDWCYIPYPKKNYDTLTQSEKCYNYIIQQSFSNTGLFKKPVDEMKKVIDTLY